MISIGFTGDFCPWRRVEDAFITGQWKPMFETVQPFFAANDLNVLDLECPLTTSTNQIKKTGPHIKANPETVEILNFLNCKLVATANNHFKDYAAEGMRATYDALNKHKIDWLGSGHSFEEASKTYYWEKDTLKFAFINIAENEWTTTFDEQSGCHPMDVVNVFNQIQEAKKVADFIIIIAHGGHEHYELPSPRMKKWYRFFIDAGASTVIGHHTHIISGYEVYKDSPIFYSLGNFCFDWEGLQNGTWNIGMMVRLQFEKGKSVSFSLEFVRHNNEQAGVYLMSAEEKKKTLAHVLNLNEIINDDLALNNKFDLYVKDWKLLMHTWIQPYKGKYLPSLHKRGLLPSLIANDKKMLLTNLIQCESHRDVLLSTINPTKK